MRRKKTLKELTLKDNFMFGAVMSDEKNCRRFLEMVMEFPIARVEVSKEKSIVYHPEYKGVRLDVYAKDENNTHYNVEMQAVKEQALFRRARYYHSQIDMELLLSGTEYSELPNSYVIFICDFDPIGLAKYRYTITNQCMESKSAAIDDGNKTIFLSTRGTNSAEVSQEMVKFLNFVKADLAESAHDFEDEFVKSLQDSVAQIKSSREMEERYMLLELVLQDERREGKAEGIVDLLQELGTVSEELQERILAERSSKKIKSWLKLAAKVDTIEQFISEM